MVAVADIEINAAASYDAEVTYRDSADDLVNLTGYSASFKIGSDPYADTGTNYLTLTSGSGLTLGGSAGTIRILISTAQTAALKSTLAALDTDRAWYQLDVIDSSSVSTRILRGKVKVIPAVP